MEPVSGRGRKMSVRSPNLTLGSFTRRRVQKIYLRHAYLSVKYRRQLMDSRIVGYAVTKDVEAIFDMRQFLLMQSDRLSTYYEECVLALEREHKENAVDNSVFVFGADGIVRMEQEVKSKIDHTERVPPQKQRGGRPKLPEAITKAWNRALDPFLVAYCQGNSTDGQMDLELINSHLNRVQNCPIN